MTRKMLIGTFICYYLRDEEMQKCTITAPIVRGVKRQKEVVETTLKAVMQSGLELIKYVPDSVPYVSTFYLDDATFYLNAKPVVKGV